MKANSKHTHVQLGIWTVVVNNSPVVPAWVTDCPQALAQLWASLMSLLYPCEDVGKGIKKIGIACAKSFPGSRTVTYFYAFMKEIYSIGSIYFIFELLLCFWKTTSQTLELYYSSRLLSAITHSLQSGQVESYPIMKALAFRIATVLLSDYISEAGFRSTAVLRERVKFHFLEKSMHSALKFDLSTLKDPEVRSKMGRIKVDLVHQRSEAWEAFYELLDTATYVATVVSELLVMVRIARSTSTFVLAVLSGLVHPLVIRFSGMLWNLSFVAFCSNSSFRRMASLHHIAFSDEFQEDRISNNLGEYIEREFKNNRMSLEDVDTESPMIQWGRRRRKYIDILSKLTLDTSLIVLAVRVLWDPKSVTLDDLVLIQQTSDAVRFSMYQLLFNTQRISEHLRTIRNIYSLAEVENKIKDEDIPYPSYEENKSNDGAEIEFRNVSFKYPGTERNALDNVSFTIKAGQLAIVVGVNGSGKTSMVRLLSRLSDPTGGEILLDGRPIASYRLEDIRRTTAILRQDHPVLPLSLRENIMLGFPERTVSDHMVEEAMNQGGASVFVHKLKQGLETVLNPVKTVTMNFTGSTDAELKSVADNIEVKTNLSGGETQRLSASRTFMRLMGGNIRLLIADEPTSALDPQGEYKLFKKLREQSGGKTSVFITHRFGHLTRHSDLILCLKDGCLVEQGDHETLMNLGGEYKELYDVQAGAFGA